MTFRTAQQTMLVHPRPVLVSAVPWVPPAAQHEKASLRAMSTLQVRLGGQRNMPAPHVRTTDFGDNALGAACGPKHWGGLVDWTTLPVRQVPETVLHPAPWACPVYLRLRDQLALQLQHSAVKHRKGNDLSRQCARQAAPHYNCHYNQQLWAPPTRSTDAIHHQSAPTSGSSCSCWPAA